MKKFTSLGSSKRSEAVVQRSLSLPFMSHLKKGATFEGPRMRKKLKIYCFQSFFKNTVLKATDIQFLKNSTLHQKISRLGGGGLLQRLSVKISKSMRYTIT